MGKKNPKKRGKKKVVEVPEEPKLKGRARKISFFVRFDPHKKPLKRMGKREVVLKKPKPEKIQVSLTPDEIKALKLKIDHHVDGKLVGWTHELKQSAIEKIKKGLGERQYEKARVESKDGKIRILFTDSPCR